MIDILCIFIFLYVYGWFKKNFERFVYMNSRMLFLMFYMVLKVMIIVGIVYVSMIIVMFFVFIIIK